MNSRYRIFVNKETNEEVKIYEHETEKLIIATHDHTFEPKEIKFLEQYSSKFGIKTYYLGQEILGREIKRIKNCSMPYPDLQCFELYDDIGKIMTVKGHGITIHYNYNYLYKIIKAGEEYENMIRNIRRAK